LIIGVLILLAIVSLGNLLLVLAVARRLRLLQELTVPQTPIPTIGSTVAPFEVTALDGSVLDEHHLNERTVLVVFLSATCPACHGLAQQLQSKRAFAEDTIIFLIAQLDDAGSQDLIQSLDGVGTLVALAENTVSDAFGGILAFPTVLMIENRQIKSAANRLDDLRLPRRLSSVFGS